MDRDRAFEEEYELDEDLDDGKEYNYKHGFIESLLYSLQNNEQSLFELLEKNVESQEQQFLLDFIQQVNLYKENIEEFGSYEELQNAYKKNLEEYKDLVEYNDMELEEFKQYMQRVIPSSVLNKGQLVVEENNLSMTLKKNKKITIGESLTQVSDYFKYNIEISDPYHITISTPFIKPLDITLVVEDYIVSFELKETYADKFVYVVELPYLPLGEYDYKIVVEDKRG